MKASNTKPQTSGKLQIPRSKTKAVVLHCEVNSVPDLTCGDGLFPQSLRRPLKLPYISATRVADVSFVGAKLLNKIPFELISSSPPCVPPDFTSTIPCLINQLV